MRFHPAPPNNSGAPCGSRDPANQRGKGREAEGNGGRPDAARMGAMPLTYSGSSKLNERGLLTRVCMALLAFVPLSTMPAQSIHQVHSGCSGPAWSKEERTQAMPCKP